MEEKRRLPLWMVGASTADKARKPLDFDANDVITKEEVMVVTESTNTKAKGQIRKHKKEVCLPSDEKSLLVKCETKRKKRRFAEKDLIEFHDHEQEVVVEKRKRGRVGRKVEEPDPSRKKGEKNEFETNNENQASSCDEDDEDLTMDDLLTIAKEFVEKDKSNTGQQKPLEGKCELKLKNLYTPSSVTTTSLIARQDTRSPKHEETTSHHDSIEDTSKFTSAGSRTTGDPAQDMLDLFLGPLLNKPTGKEEASSIKDIILPHELKNQQHDAVTSNKPVTLTKKKSSLRDTVAMLLE